MLFEQKTSANQLRSTKAFEAAESGIEWATSMLNDPRYISASCSTGTGNTQSFRTKYLSYDASAGFTPATTARPGCSISTTSGTPALSCSCPAAGDNPSLSSTTNPTFSVTFAPVDTTTPDKESILVTSYGCTSAGTQCVPGSTTGTADAYQKISVILKLRPAVRAVPAATITAGGSVDMASAASKVTNTDPSSNGILVDAGNTCCGKLSKANMTTLPGIPVDNGIITGDTSLSTLSSSQDNMFQAFFGTTVTQFKTDPGTKVLTAKDCGTKDCGTNCASKFQLAFDEGYRSFYLEADMSVSNGTIGTQAAPIILATSANLKFNGTTQVWGLIYADTAVSWDPDGLGSGGVHGALVTRGSFSPNANADYIYDAEALKNIRGSTGSMVRVPGSWKDF